jgi:hypothetical protein
VPKQKRSDVNADGGTMNGGIGDLAIVRACADVLMNHPSW